MRQSTLLCFLVLLFSGFALLESCEPHKQPSGNSEQLKTDSIQNARIDSLENYCAWLESQNYELKKQMDIDYANLSPDLDYLFAVGNRSDSFLMKESGRGRLWRKVGRNYGYLRDGLGVVGVRLP